MSKNYKKALNTFQEAGSIIKTVDAVASTTDVADQIFTIIWQILKQQKTY